MSISNDNLVLEEIRHINFNPAVAEIKAKILGFKEFPFSAKLSFRSLIKDWETRLESEDFAEALLARTIMERVREVPEFLEPIENEDVLKQHKELVDLLLAGLFPFSHQDYMGMATRPFHIHGFYYSKKLQKLVHSDEITYSTNISPELAQAASIAKACTIILNKFYGQKIDFNSTMTFTVQPTECGLQSHVKPQLNLDFVEIVPLKPLKPLTQEQINRLLSNVYDLDLWLQLIPPDHFEFQGIVKVDLVDVTDEESLSRLKDKLLRRDALTTADNMKELEQHIRNFFRMPDVRLGIMAIDYPMNAELAHRHKIRQDFLADTHPNLLAKEFAGSIYEQVSRTKEWLIVEDLTNVAEPTQLEVDLLNKKIRSIILVPLTGKKGKLIGLLEIGSPVEHELNSLTLLKIKEILPLFCIAVERSRNDIEHKIQSFIREKYTTIHPSIEWKFLETAYDQLEKQQEQDWEMPLTPIVFDDVYPLYGQADIVSSSTIRNKAIQADFIQNLELIESVLNLADERLDFPLLKQYKFQVKDKLHRFRENINSNDETQMMDFIRAEIHPLFDHLQQLDVEVERAVQQYAKKLNPALGMIYNERKAYEESVVIINDTISRMLDEEQIRAQKMLPHYFEKYKTDGVQHELYVGQSLLKEGQFSNIHLSNLRLFQLLIMCDITRKMEELKEEMPLPLSTAQLIFVYSSPLSIRFRTDEKRFDVDGAYNIRYEIIKKRIDKALVEGTGQRLTLAGKIAIVYTSERDKEEYLKYIQYLIENKYISNEVEDLSLEHLQGIQGLKALRITVLKK